MKDRPTSVTRTALALAIACGVAGSSPALAQSGAIARLVIKDAMALCLQHIRQDGDVRAQFEDEGWLLEAPYKTPFYSDLSGTRDYDGFGTGYVWGFIESYPAHRILYCSFDIYDSLEPIDIATLDADPALVGEVAQTDDGTFGTWQMRGEDEVALVQAYFDGKDFHYQVTQTQHLAE